MEYKINFTQIIGAILQTIGYIGSLIVFAWVVARHVTKIESRVDKALDKITETNIRMEKTFDKIDRTFERIDEKIDRRGS
jgi:hypothetical protein